MRNDLRNVKKCIRCKKWKPKTEFYFRKDTQKFENRCRVCRKKDNASWEAAHKEKRRLDNIIWKTIHRKSRRAYNAIWQRKWRKAHPEIVQAQNVLGNAVRAGRVFCPNVCSICSRTNCRIHGHHPDYSKPLDVIWLCSSCHKKLHLQLKQEKPNDIP